MASSSRPSPSSLMVSGYLEQFTQTPTHGVLVDLTDAARHSKRLATREFRKLVAYLLELADGRDRREPWTTRPGDARPVPKLRVAIEEVFGIYGDLQWFRLNKAANAAKRPLTGLFPRMAAGLSRVAPEDFAAVLGALHSAAPDAALLKLLQARGGKIRGMGVEVFSRLAYAYRRDLYFVLPKPWGETSGTLKFIGDDLRRYCGLCRNLRAVCDDLGISAAVRGSVLDHLLHQKKPPTVLLEALHKALGPSLARFRGLEPDDAYVSDGPDDASGMPLEFAARSIRARRGIATVRAALIKAYGERCALTGRCLRDLLEVADVCPYPVEEERTIETTLPMRSDVHTLWDLNLIGIDAATRRIHVAPKLSGTSYEKLAGRTLLPRRDGGTMSGEVLRERWTMYVSANGGADRSNEAADGARQPIPGREQPDREQPDREQPERESSTRPEPAAEPGALARRP